MFVHGNRLWMSVHLSPSPDETNKWCSADGSYFIEIDRLLRPGGYFVLSGPPVNFEGKEKDYEFLQELIVEKMCYASVATYDKTAIWQKPTSASCHLSREKQVPPFCTEDDPDNAW